MDHDSCLTRFVPRKDSRVFPCVGTGEGEGEGGEGGVLAGDTIAVDRPIYVLVVTVVGGGRVRGGVAGTQLLVGAVWDCLSVGFAVDWLEFPSVLSYIPVGIIVCLWAYTSVNMSVYGYVGL